MGGLAFAQLPLGHYLGTLCLFGLSLEVKRPARQGRRCASACRSRTALSFDVVVIRSALPLLMLTHRHRVRPAELPSSLAPMARPVLHVSRRKRS